MARLSIDIDGDVVKELKSRYPETMRRFNSCMFEDAVKFALENGFRRPKETKPSTSED